MAQGSFRDSLNVLLFFFHNSFNTLFLHFGRFAGKDKKESCTVVHGVSKKMNAHYTKIKNLIQKSKKEGGFARCPRNA